MDQLSITKQTWDFEIGTGIRSTKITLALNEFGVAFVSAKWLEITLKIKCLPDSTESLINVVLTIISVAFYGLIFSFM